MQRIRQNGTAINWGSRLLELKDTPSSFGLGGLRACWYIYASDATIGKMIDQAGTPEYGRNAEN